MTESLLMFTPLNIFKANSLRDKLFYHWIFNIAGATFILLGFFAIYINKDNNQKDHFVSYHGLFGVTSVSYTLIQASAGFFAKYPLIVKNFIKARLLKLLHSISGSIAYFVGIFSLFLAFYSTWMGNNMNIYFHYFYISVFGLIFLYIAKGVIKKVYKYLF